MKGKILAATLVFLGIILLIYTWQPIILWHFFKKPDITRSSLLSPLSNHSRTQSPPQDIFFETTGNFENLKNSQNFHFYLTIEKFGINKATVVTGDNFLTSLAHFPGSATPGTVGNLVISGHATLPQFFRPDNYWSIFSKLYLMEVSDKIILETDSESFTYQVAETLAVKPFDTWVLNPPDPYGVYLTLLTCGVGGLTQDRIIIRATLLDSQKLI